MHSSGLAQLLGGSSLHHSQVLYSAHEGRGAEAVAFIKTSAAGLCIFADLQVQGSPAISNKAAVAVFLDVNSVFILVF